MRPRGVRLCTPAHMITRLVRSFSGVILEVCGNTVFRYGCVSRLSRLAPAYAKSLSAKIHSYTLHTQLHNLADHTVANLRPGNHSPQIASLTTHAPPYCCMAVYGMPAHMYVCSALAAPSSAPSSSSVRAFFMALIGLIACFTLLRPFCQRATGSLAAAISGGSKVM